MSQPFIGEIKMFGGNFAINGYAKCDGQLMAIDQNDALFALIGTTYGGDGQTTFALPDLRGRIPVHQSNTFPIGQLAGTETVTLISQQLPVHNHSVNASSGTSGSGSPSPNYVGTTSGINPFSKAAITNQLSGQSISASGGSQPHDNLMPFLCVNFIIALFGIFPPRN